MRVRVATGVVMASVLIAGGCGGSGSTDRGRKQQAQAGSHCGFSMGPTPARLIQDQGKVAGGFFPTQDLWPVTGQWQAGDCNEFTAVDAGADAGHRSDGLFGIVHIPKAGHEVRQLITVPGAGPLTITRAPLGPDVETTAQKQGDIEFKGSNGITGTLHLSDGTVTLDGQP